MNRFWMMALVAVGSLVAGSAQAAIVNGSFEDVIDFNGWTLSDPTNSFITPSEANFGGGAPDPFLPTNGNQFAYLQSDAQDVPTSLSQSFTALAGDSLTFNAFFQTSDSFPFSAIDFNDTASITLSDSNGVLSSFSINIADVGLEGSFGWSTFIALLPNSDTYTLTFQVTNIGDDSGASFLGVDNVVLTSAPPPPPPPAVPEPSSLILFGLGAIGLGCKLRRRK